MNDDDWNSGADASPADDFARAMRAIEKESHGPLVDAARLLDPRVLPPAKRDGLRGNHIDHAIIDEALELAAD